MADIQDTRAKVITVIAEQLGVGQETIKDDATLDSLGADSLDRVEMVMKLEEIFGIEIDDSAADTLKTVSDVVQYIQSLRK